MSASHVFVLDSTFKRTQVKVTPGKYLKEVLEEACKARKWNPESYALKTQTNKTVDLSQPFRLSGLSGGAKLTLIQASRSPSVVNVALQLPESEGGGRLSDKFPSTTSLWLVLRKYEDAVAGQPPRKLNLTQRGVPPVGSSGAGQLEYEQPCLHLMGRNMETFGDLQKSFAQLGINDGSVLMRLTFKSDGRPLEEAMKLIEEHFQSADTVPAGVGSSASQAAPGTHATAPGSLQSLPDADADNANVSREGAAGPEPAEPDTLMPDADGHETARVQDDVITSSSITQPDSSTNEEPLNGIAVYLPPSSSTPAAALQEDDPALFEPSIDHAKAHQAALTRMTRNTRLLSDKELAEQEETRQASLAQVNTVTVRVRYPDQSMIETTVSAASTAAELYAQVAGTLASTADAQGKFELRYTGAKGHQTLPDSTSKRLVRDLGFRGKVLVTLIWMPEASAQARQGPSLKEEYRSRAKDLKVELATQQAAGEESHKAAMNKKESGAAASKGKGGGDVEAKMKKFLGFGKKK
ncbi:ubx domain-containing protein [Zymoseptoria brevis]|uniref:Ubx domain-containing protein n=1 Tax=Zymoseptoria brevis TaxID=1047168 RepID=A0A0F4GKB1_9PEZI|nr:ubx domain-containing protein [Zymoseptoria brevis]